MFRRIAYAFAIGLLAGCNSQTNDSVVPPYTAPAPNNDVDHIVDSLARMQMAKTEHDRFAAAWPIVLANAKKSDTCQLDTGAPVSLSLELASDPHDWSLCVATRNITDGVAPSTIRIELAIFVAAIPWKPTKDASFNGSFRRFGDGESDLLEWHLEDNSNETVQQLALRFRLKSH